MTINFVIETVCNSLSLILSLNFSQKQHQYIDRKYAAKEHVVDGFF